MEGTINYSLEFKEETKTTAASVNCKLKDDKLSVEDVTAAYMIVYADLMSDKNITQKDSTIKLIQSKIDIFTSSLKHQEEEVF